MAEKNKSYRIRTTVGREADSFLEVHLDQDYDTLEILSLKLSDKDTYKLHNSDYGVVVGRVLANGNFGVPNAKISVFIPTDEQNENMEMWNLYPYTSTSTKNEKDIRYNLLPDESVKDCHKAVGTFPHKTYLLENDALLEVFDKYYVYTTRTNAAGDYLICGVPTGMQTLHMDLDLSDCGVLSQRPRDFVYKGYTIEQFENPNQFKKDENIDGLSQIFTQNQPVYVKPFWGNQDNGEEIGITRADIQIAFKFEPTCVFMGSAISDNASNGVGKKCVPTNQMGAMDELTAGEGTIEMIRKTPGGHVEEFSIKGNQLINGNGVWCYQIPMNLDYMMTDEYGRMVPTDDPEKGIPTRARVRFRASLTDMEESSQSYYRAKYLIPNNPSIEDQKVDYNFGTYTDESSYRDLFWNGVYTVKSYIPRFQKSKRWKNERFSGIKACNYYGGNNPMPYNNLRIKLPFMFTVLCIFVKLFIKIVSLINRIIAGIIRVFIGLMDALTFLILSPLYIIGVIIRPVKRWADKQKDRLTAWALNGFIKKYGVHCTFIGDGLCPDMEGWYFAPGCTAGIKNSFISQTLMNNTLAAALGNGDKLDDEADSASRDAINSTEFIDETSTDTQNMTTAEEDTACVTVDVDYLVNCFEMNLAQEYRVIKFDFYNDWVNGVLYFPRWMRKIKRKKKYKISLNKGISGLITTYYKDKVQGCMNAENSTVKKTRYYTQQCSVAYTQERPNSPYNVISSPPACYTNAKSKKKKKKKNTSIIPTKCHKKQGMSQFGIFGKKSGLVTEETTMLGQYVYYLKPCEWKDSVNGGKTRVLLFATDIVLLGTLNDCDENGIPQAFKYLNNSSYVMPTNLALTTMDDDAYIYAGKDGTVCSSTKSGKESVKTENNVYRVTPDYQSTNSAYSKTDGDQVDYGENDDPIPVTEAAGITWNYSGPGQDDVSLGKVESPGDLLGRLFGSGVKNRLKYLYYPGGHFLGLSCVNSESNIKSCVNLKRICEMGASMSQRREEMRGYDTAGTPYYYYYVPTGLISNVDVEIATFRSMFATINHNKLIADKRNEETGYKTYTFRFLRPDGFDGALTDYVHQANSPYNKKVNDGIDGANAITDATDFFTNLFAGWSKPDDYDPYEVDATSRRTVEDAINDYYMFRFGLDTFSDKEQKKHFLDKNLYGLLLPQYENSFYFYFGLKDGSTALDEFKKQFFSECESNNVMKAPAIIIKEHMEKDLSNREATVVIDNMLAPYTVTLSDNTVPIKLDPFVLEEDTFDVGRTISKHVTDYTMQIGHEYTVKITDSIEQTIEKTFVFGASAIKMETEAVHFRLENPGTFTNDPKKGGFVKLNDNIKILRQDIKISDTAQSISFTFKRVVSGSEVGDEIIPVTSTYEDSFGELQHIYYLSGTGTYNMYLKCDMGSGASKVSVYTFTLEDNTKVNVYVACNYLGYKADPDPNSPGNKMPSMVLSSLTEDQLLNSAEIFGQNTPDSWLMRHTFYRQTEDDTAGYDHYVYASGKNNLAVFGQAENAESLVVSATVTSGTYFQNDYDKYEDFSLDDKYSFVTTKYWDPINAKETTENTVFRRPFDVMAYSDDGRAASDATNIVISGYNFVDGEITLTYTGSAPGIVQNHGCIVVFENGLMLFPVVVSDSEMVAYSQYNIYPPMIDEETGLPVDGWDARLSNLLAMATVYPTMRVPSFYKPFYGEVTATTWNNMYLDVTASDSEGVFVARKAYIPTSYKIEGDIYNGLLYTDGNTGHFYPGEKEEDEPTISNYETYFIFRDSEKFWESLTGNPAQDCNPKRKLEFGRGNDIEGFCRDIEYNPGSEDVDDYDDFDDIIYAVKENTPPEEAFSNKMNVFTERYEGGFDRVVLLDSCSISDAFYNDLKIKVVNDNDGISGEFMLYTEESEISGASVYLTNVNLFDYQNDVLRQNIGDAVVAYGYYNHNVKYDKKGNPVTVSITGSNFEFPITQENGTVITERAGSVSAAETKGVTLLHNYKASQSVKTGATTAVTNALQNAYIAKPRFKNRSAGGDVFTNVNSYNAVIQKYEKPRDGSKNKMLVYRLDPIRNFDVVFPEKPGGVEAYITPTVAQSYPAEGGTITITVKSNVTYRIDITSSSSWLSLNGGPEFGSGERTISFTMDENTSSNQRSATIKIESLDDVGPNGGKLTVTETIKQNGTSNS